MTKTCSTLLIISGILSKFHRVHLMGAPLVLCSECLKLVTVLVTRTDTKKYNTDIHRRISYEFQQRDLGLNTKAPHLSNSDEALVLSALDGAYESLRKWTQAGYAGLCWDELYIFACGSRSEFTV